MSEKPKKKPKKPKKPVPPDGLGERPTDPNELAKWIVEQSIAGNDVPPASYSHHDGSADNSVE